jgi:hypothetical protein
MPRTTGLQAARELSRTMPHLRILMLTMYDNEQYFFEALRVGAAGYVLKSVADRDLVEACRAAMRDEPFLYPGAETTLIRNYLEHAGDLDTLPAKSITDREEEVLKLVAEGHSSKQIADLLFICQDRGTAPLQHPAEARPARPARTHPLCHPHRVHRTLTVMTAFRPRRALRTRWSGELDLAGRGHMADTTGVIRAAVQPSARLSDSDHPGPAPHHR